VSKNASSKVNKTQFKTSLKKRQKQEVIQKQKKQGTKGWAASLYFSPLECGSMQHECKLCNRIIRITPANNSNLSTHLKLMHADDWVSCLEKMNDGKTDMEAFVKITTKSQKANVSSQTLTQTSMMAWVNGNGITQLARVKLSILIWLIHSQIAFHPFGTKHFDRFKCESKILLDSPHLMKQSTASLHAVVRQLAEDRLSRCLGVSVSADLWTSLAKRKYLVITYHGIIYEDFELIHHVLDLIPFPGPAMGTIISRVLQTRIASHVTCNVTSIVPDSGSNMVKAGEDMKVSTHLCFAHGLKGVIDVVCGDEPKATSYHLHCAETALDLETVKVIANLLQTTQWLQSELHGEEDDVLVLIVENLTRWEGKFRALERFLKLQTALVNCQVLREYVETVDMKNVIATDELTKPFFKRLVSHKECLEVFHVVSKASQAENVCSISSVPNWLWKIEEECSNGSTFGAKLVLAVNERLVPKYLHSNSVALKAALLDPWKFEEVKRKGLGCDDTWANIMTEVTNVEKEEDPVQAQLLETMVLQSRALVEKEMLAWSVGNPNKTALQFWSAMKKKGSLFFLPVAKVANILLATPTTSAPSERTFSSTTGVVTKTRNSINQKCFSFESIAVALESAIKGSLVDPQDMKTDGEIGEKKDDSKVSNSD
jgi:hypothetical protein